MSSEALTLDKFLGGRITVAQPADGFRAGHDAVLLAAAVPAQAGSAVVELGSGAGVASLCLAARVAGVRITGVEIDPDLVRVAQDNAERNGLPNVAFVTGDVTSLLLEPGGADCVFFNPPFHPDTGQVSPLAGRDRARRDRGDAVREWTKSALSLVRDGGTVTAIVRADRTQDILQSASACAGVVFPLFPREGAKPKRVIVRIVKASGTVQLTAGLVLHERDGRNTQAAERVLRHAEALDLSP